MPGNPSSGNPLADQVWRTMTAVVFDNRDSWRRAVVERTGLPFSRIRILRRLAKTPMTAKQLGRAATMDAPATTVALNDLEGRGLVVREIDPANRRSKIISLTEAGRATVAVVEATDDPAPAPIGSLSDADLSTLGRLLSKLADRTGDPA